MPSKDSEVRRRYRLKYEASEKGKARQRAYWHRKYERLTPLERARLIVKSSIRRSKQRITTLREELDNGVI